MSRKPNFPPRPHVHASSGQERVKYRGKHFYLGPAGSDEAKREYARLLAHWVAGGAGRPATDRTQLLNVSEVWAAFMAHAIDSRDPREIRQFEALRRVIDARWGQIPADRFDSLAVIELQRILAARWTRRVVNRQIVRLRTCWRWAETRRLVPKGSWDHLRSVPGLRKNDAMVRNAPVRKLATFAMVKAVAMACPWRIGRALLLQWWTGMRSCEVRLMRPMDIDRAEPVWVYRPHGHKGDWREGETETSRAVAMGPKCKALLHGLLDGNPAGYIFAPPKRGKVRRKPFYDEMTYAQVVRRAARKIGIVNFRPYDLRHAAKQRFTRMYGLDVARALLGQRSLSTTNGYGLQLDLETATKAARKAS